MPEILNSKKARDLKVLTGFVSIYCQQKHAEDTKSPLALRSDILKQVLGGKEIMLCRDCSRLLSHGIAKLMLCPYDPKPMCKKCKTHCYAPGYRDKMRIVMRFSGLFFIKKGRLDMLIHYLF